MTVRVAEVFVSNLDELTVPVELSRQLRRADDFIRLAVVAGHNVLQQAAATEGNKERIGLFLGSAFGPMQTNFDVLDQVVSDQPVSPILFSHSVFNGAAGYLASVFGIKGCALTMTDFNVPFIRSLEQGIQAIEGGSLDCCLVLQIETYSRLLHDARKTHCPEDAEWQPGVVCWLLKAAASADDGIVLKRVSSQQQLKDDDEIDAANRLRVVERLNLVEEVLEIRDPLGAAITLSSLMRGDGSAANGKVISLESEHTTVELEFCS
ncbi:beta-ketoacyl synthase N-terminal-like domain-containing protein [Desulfosediminicola sp.]|uniref:beta-ketoacyl synthase N-terminal-like domain-containing protein n=1 Tax=Desulfosediminicola sp. TaxID=2886825 RepID=UPI003AF22F26